jgi:four helix bundle protein
MAGVKRFEELLCWKKARELTREVYKISSDVGFRQDFGLRDQIRRAAVSTMSNIAEGFGRNGNREFLRFLNYAKGSAEEVHSLLYVAADAGFLSSEGFRTLYDLADVVSSLLTGLIKHLRNHSE